jgi:hypothetical protein
MEPNIQTEELESIASLSSDPLEDLSHVIEQIENYVGVSQTAPSIIKPFLKRDVPTVSSLDEEELLGLLKNIKESFESINKTISSILKDDFAAAPEVKKAPEKKKKSKESRKATDSIQVKKESKVPPSPEKKESEVLPSSEKKEAKVSIVYCPECGHKCVGKKGLKVHIFQVHNDIREKMLKKYAL